MTHPGQNVAAAHVAAMIATHGGTWRPRLIDADCYDTPTAAARIESRVPEGGVFTMYRACVGVLLLAIVLLSLAAAPG